MWCGMEVAVLLSSYGITLIELSPAVWAGVLNKCRYVQIELEGKG